MRQSIVKVFMKHAIDNNFIFYSYMGAIKSVSFSSNINSPPVRPDASTLLSSERPTMRACLPDEALAKLGRRVNRTVKI